MARNLATQVSPAFRKLLLGVSIDPKEIGRRIAAARERLGWTQAVFAREASVSISSVQRWERGDLPPVRELIRLAGVLRIDPEQLVEVEPTEADQLAELRKEMASVHEMLAELLRRSS
jgi:transcriptional regulator with XRE-family HTH domain